MRLVLLVYASLLEACITGMRRVLLVYASLLEACITGMRRVLLVYALLLEACHRNRHQTYGTLHELSVLIA